MGKPLRNRQKSVDKNALLMYHDSKSARYIGAGKSGVGHPQGRMDIIMVNVAMLSKWHVHAEDYARQILATGKARITAVWDEEPARGRDWAERLGCDFEADLDTLLSRKDVDAVVCDTPTTMHHEVLVKAARAGKHIYTEKAMAPTVRECEDIAQSVRESGVTFVISYPQRTSPGIQLAKQMVENGDFGKISRVRIRNGHNGVSGGWLPDYWFDASKSAGGALMDLGCHPMYLAAYLLGEPKRVHAMMTQPFGTGMDENAVSTIEFANGAICTAETSFITLATPDSLEIFGTDATFLMSGGEVKIMTAAMAKVTSDYVRPRLPQGLPSPIAAFVDACETGSGSPTGFGVEDGIALTRLLEASYLSCRENRVVEL